MAEPSKSTSTWSPLRVGAFRALWIAVLVANIGTWMQTVGAQWLLVHLPHAAILVALDGPSGAGKSTIAEAIRDVLPVAVAIIPGDDFFAAQLTRAEAVALPSPRQGAGDPSS